MFTDRLVSRLGMLFQETTRKLAASSTILSEKGGSLIFWRCWPKFSLCRFFEKINSNKDCRNDRNTSSDVRSGLLQAGVE